jgi:glyceraldehyde 3-phosphate dehydrogenase
MAIRVAINGFGRIGRSVFRIGVNRKDIQFVALNDITDKETLAYLLRYDTVHGAFPQDVKLQGDTLVTGSQKMKMLTESDPLKLPWKALNVDVVIESTGRFRSRAEVATHIEAGARRVILTVPPKDALDAMVVLGVNDQILRPEHKLISNASCTTNCLAPIAKILSDSFGIEYGLMTTVHAYTNDQRLGDVFHKDFRRARAANENIIPTTTGAAKAVGKILPELNGKLDGMSMRVPIPDGSITDFVALLKKSTTAKDVNDAVRSASEGGMKGIVQYSDAPIVSSDIVGNPHSAIFDAPFTKVLRGNFVKTLSWYDNEWGYSSRCVDLIERIASL